LSFAFVILILISTETPTIRILNSELFFYLFSFGLLSLILVGFLTFAIDSRVQNPFFMAFPAVVCPFLTMTSQFSLQCLGFSHRLSSFALHLIIFYVH
jgi:hypothetical protein